MVSRQQPHVRILPENRANAEIATEFLVECGSPRQMQILPEAGGRDKVIAAFGSEYTRVMKRDSQGLMILLIDLDDNEDFQRYSHQVPEDPAERVFVVGAKPDPEGLRAKTQLKFAQLGERLARECESDKCVLWEHESLQHNLAELKRLREHIRPILFPPD